MLCGEINILEWSLIEQQLASKKPIHKRVYYRTVVVIIMIILCSDLYWLPNFVAYYSAFAFARFPISGGQRITESESADCNTIVYLLLQVCIMSLTAMKTTSLCSL